MHFYVFVFCLGEHGGGPDLTVLVGAAAGGILFILVLIITLCCVCRYLVTSNGSNQTLKPKQYLFFFSGNVAGIPRKNFVTLMGLPFFLFG